VLDPAPRRHAGSERVLERLGLLERGDADDVVRAGLQAAVWPAGLADLAPPGVLDPAEAEASLARLVAAGEAVRLDGDPPAWLTSGRYDALRTEIGTRLRERAEQEPLDPGLPLGGLVGQGRGRDALVERLRRDGVLVREGAVARATGARANAAAVHAEAAAALLAALEAGGATPPDLPTLAAASGLAPREFQALCRALEREGRIVRFGEDLATTSDRFDDARRVVVETAEAEGSITLAGLRDRLGTSRRIAQALLERLDADGVTRRVGDERVLRRRPRKGTGPTAPNG